MSQYGIIYRLEFINVEGFTVRVNISPTDTLIDDLDDPQIITLTGSDQPLIMSVSNNDQAKFQQIRSKVAKIQFVTNTADGLDSSTFSQGGDDLWKVDIYLQDTPELIFTGFLIMADNQQPFQPDPEYVTLTATDHLGVLQDAPLVDFDGNNPIGKYRVAELIAMALNKTGLALNINVVNNLKPGGGQLTNTATFSFSGNYMVTDGLLTSFFYPGQEVTIAGSATHDGTYNVDYVVQSTITEVHFVETIASPGETAVDVVFTDTSSAAHWYDSVYIDVKTFEAEIGVSEDCQTVLNKIFGEDCYITQYKGQWWIYRVDEINELPVYVATFNSSGDYVSTAAGTQYDISIGATESFKFANADTLLRFIRPHGFVKETFNFNTPAEIPCNIDFERGDLVTTVSQYQKQYDIECWLKLWSNTSTDDPQNTGIYIERTFNEVDYELSRYVVLEANATRFTFIMSEAIDVQIKDRFNLQVQRRMAVDIAGTGAYRDPDVQVRLYGEDGTFWTYHPKNSGAGEGVRYWEECDSTFRTNQHFFYHEGDASEDQTDAVSLYDGDAIDIPVSGYIKILVYRSSLTGWGNLYDTYIDSVTFEYLPYINGTYSKFSGQYSRVDRIETGYQAKQDNEVYISDSPKPILKGSMFLSDTATLYTGSVLFYTGTGFQISGNLTAIFRPGMTIIITGTTSNNITAKITITNYSIIGDLTQIILDAVTVSETVTATFEYLVFHLFPVWYSSQEFALGYPTSSSSLHPYGYIQAFSVWNQFKGVNDPTNGRGLGINIFSGSVVGLTSNWPDMIHRFTLTDLNVQTNDRYFMLISMEQNWRTCIWTATLVEVFNSTVGKTYTDTFEFKYIPA